MSAHSQAMSQTTARQPRPTPSPTLLAPTSGTRPGRHWLGGALMALGLALSGAPAPALAKPVAQMTSEDKATLAQVESYLNNLRTLQADFQQINEDGSLAHGTFKLKRPGRMRIDYDAPNHNFIVADGSFVYYWDAESKEQSNAPIGSTLADFILRPDLKLSGDVTVTDFEHQEGVIAITLVQTKDPGLGHLTLIFEDRPLQLRKWRVLDAQGTTTEVALMNAETDVSLPDSLFYFRDPNKRKERD